MVCCACHFARVQPYERFTAFELCHELAIDVYRSTEGFPKREWYGGIASQLRRAAFSAANNIVEGSSRRGAGEFRHFLDIAWGSVSEVGYGLRFARDAGFLTDEAYARLYAKWIAASKATWKLLSAVTKSADRDRKKRRSA